MSNTAVTGPDWCDVTRVPTANTWVSIDPGKSRASRVLLATGKETDKTKTPNLTTVTPEKPIVQWSK